MDTSVSGYDWVWTATGDTSLVLGHYLDTYLTFTAGAMAFGVPITGNVRVGGTLYNTGMALGVTNYVVNYNSSTKALSYNQSNGGSTTFLRADGAWATPAGTGTVSIASGDTNNYIMTSTGVGSELQGESELTYDGTTLSVDGILSVGGSATTSVIKMNTSVSGYDWIWTATGDTSLALTHYLDTFVTFDSSGMTVPDTIIGENGLEIEGASTLDGTVTIGGTAATSTLKFAHSGSIYGFQLTATGDTSLVLSNYLTTYLSLSSTQVVIGPSKLLKGTGGLEITGASSITGATTLDGAVVVGGSAATSTFKMAHNASAYGWLWTADADASLTLSNFATTYFTIAPAETRIHNDTLVRGDLEVEGNLILDTVEYTTITTHTPPASARYINVTVPPGTGTIYVDLDNIEDEGNYATIFITYKITSVGTITITVRNKANATVHTDTATGYYADGAVMLLWDETNGVWYKQVLT
jgi:hypothetical protein